MSHKPDCNLWMPGTAGTDADYCNCHELPELIQPEHVAIDKPRPEFLDLALKCGADLTGKPDGYEAVTVVFSIEAWAKFDLANRK